MLIFTQIGQNSRFGHIFTFLAHFLKSLTQVLYIVGISDFFPNFLDEKKAKKLIFFIFLFNGPPYFQMKIGDRNIEVRGPIFGMWPTSIIYNGNLSEMKWSLAKLFFWRTLGRGLILFPPPMVFPRIAQSIDLRLLNSLDFSYLVGGLI